MEQKDPTDLALNPLFAAYGGKMMALEVMVRALAKTHPNPAALVDAIRYYEEGLRRSLGGTLHPSVPELLQSIQDQAGLG